MKTVTWELCHWNERVWTRPWVLPLVAFSLGASHPTSVSLQHLHHCQMGRIPPPTSQGKKELRQSSGHAPCSARRRHPVSARPAVAACTSARNAVCFCLSPLQQGDFLWACPLPKSKSFILDMTFISSMTGSSFFLFVVCLCFNFFQLQFPNL